MNIQPIGARGLGKALVITIAVLTVMLMTINWWKSSNPAQEAAPGATAVTQEPVLVATLPPPDTTNTYVPEDVQEALDTSIVQQDTGITDAAFIYRPTADDISGLASLLASYNPSKQSRSQWEKLQDQWSAYTPNDYPRAMVMEYAPPASSWSSYGGRAWFPTGDVKLGNSSGQGNGKTYTWLVPGTQATLNTSGQVVDQFNNDLTITVQCAGETFDTCRVLYLTTRQILSEAY